MDTGGLNSLKPTRHLWEHLKGKKVGQNYYKITSKTKEEENKQQKKPLVSLLHALTRQAFFGLSAVWKGETAFSHSPHTQARTAQREVFSSRLCSLL